MLIEGKERNKVREEGWIQWRQRGIREMGGSRGLIRLNPKQKTSYLHMKSQWHDYTLTHTHTKCLAVLRQTGCNRMTEQ